MSEQFPSAELPGGLEQFERAATVLAEVIARRPDYFNQEDTYTNKDWGEEHTDLTKGEFIMQQLQQAREDFRDGTLPLLRTIDIFHGRQSRDTNDTASYANSQLVSDLYDSFTPPNQRKDYHDIVNDARALAGANRVVVEMKGYRETERTRLDKAALESANGELTGVQLRVGENMFVNFSLGNFGQPEKVGSYTAVTLLVEWPFAPSENPTLQ